MKQVGKTALGAAFGFSITFVVFYLLEIEKVLFESPTSDVPKQALLAVFLVCILAILQCVSGIVTRTALRANRSHPNTTRPKLRRPIVNIGSRILFNQVVFACLLYVLAEKHGLTANSIGFRGELDPWASFGIGFFVYLLFAHLLARFLMVIGAYNKVLDCNMQTMALLWPRTQHQRCKLLLGLCVLNPAVEEIMFRGILVHQFGLAIGSYTMPILVGLIATLGNHAYQGRLAISTHLPFYILVVGLLFSPTGMWGAIGFHFAGDLIPVRSLKGSMQLYRQRHRHPDTSVGGEVA